MNKHINFFITLLLCIFKLSVLPVQAENTVISSKDGVPIAYSTYGEGEYVLVFVHGWNCDSQYWKEQIPYFSEMYQVVTIDLAGHGNSGLERQIYSLDEFGEDVKAVIQDIDAANVILIGHSMGGGVIAKATLLMPDRVIGLIGVDALQNVERAMDKEEFNRIVEAYKKDFPSTVESFVEGMFAATTDGQLKSWIIKDMRSAPAKVGISAFQEFVGTFENGGMASIFDMIDVPVRCINADLWPTDIESNRRHMKSFDVEIIKGVSHFLMLESPDEFNQKLDNAIQQLIKSK